MKNDPTGATGEAVPEIVGTMRSYLDRHPDLKETNEHHRQRGTMVPIVQGGELVAWVNHRSLDHVRPKAGIRAADYIVGLECLGYRFGVFTQRDGRRSLYTEFPEHGVPRKWERHTIAIMDAFGNPRDRLDEIVSFLDTREASR